LRFLVVKFLIIARSHPPFPLLKELLEEGDNQVCARGLAFKEILGQNRIEPSPRKLNYLTIPPGRDELLQGVDRV
jgi:hypothetical protein